LTSEPTPRELKLISANRSHIESLGTVDVELSIQGLAMPWTMHVSKSLAHQVILAQDFLDSAGACIDCASRSISPFDDMVCVPLMKLNDRNTVLKLAQDVVIPAATEALVKLSVPRQFQHKTSIIETYAPLKNKCLLVQGALIHPKSNFTV
jgi:hypothetical protein